MQYNKNENLTAQNSAVQTSLVHDTDKRDMGMNLEQLNEYLVKRGFIDLIQPRHKSLSEDEMHDLENKELRSIVEKQKKEIEWQWGLIASQARVIERLSVGTKQDNPDGPCKVIKMTPR
jgi:hypothetical protein